ncbi:MAG: MarR family transcriptional regulator, partial [Marinilabiliales bacterium]|nr:MarR family transcriptional regulator [Marinilabiliales bacterium]
MEYRLEESVNHRVATLAILLKRQVFRLIAEDHLRITPEQWVVLYALWQEDALTVGELSNRTRKDFANTTRIVDKLGKLGFVAKIKSVHDGRSTTVHILPAAEALQEPLQRCWKRSTDLAMQGISEAEQRDFLKILERIEQNIL